MEQSPFLETTITAFINRLLIPTRIDIQQNCVKLVLNETVFTLLDHETEIECSIYQSGILHIRKEGDLFSYVINTGGMVYQGCNGIQDAVDLYLELHGYCKKRVAPQDRDGVKRQKI